ncbi:ATP-dependent DNA helicase [Mycena kentingensis (nom. inval.)]|nr:ATP-dependent DNA helicase [Mycena kentingensis (nom. inval.)]
MHSAAKLSTEHPTRRSSRQSVSCAPAGSSERRPWNAVQATSATRLYCPPRNHIRHKQSSTDAYSHGPALRQQRTFICRQCKAAIDRGKTPVLSLANNMWIGEIPFELRVLTLPERLLISLNFPAAFIVKLYSKDGSPTPVNTALRGNVSTYRLHAPAVADMLVGNILPQPVGLLASIIAVTFVGRKLRPLYGLKRILQVRRQRVVDALRWLKVNNPLYAEYHIDETRVANIPEDDVPEEISMNIRYSDDTDAVEREHSGYVPENVTSVGDDIGEEGEGLEFNVEGRHKLCGEPLAEATQIWIQMSATTTKDPTDASDEPIIPLRAHGVVDVGADAVTDVDLFGHGTDNLIPAFAPPEEQEWYRVRKGDAFVNEYARLDKNGERFDGGPGNPNLLLGAFPTLFPYGKGGIEVNRDRVVSFEAHMRWALQYDDCRFRKDVHFIFMGFGVFQKRQVCRSSSLQMKRSSWHRNRAAIERLTVNDLIDASHEEQRRVPFSNPAVKSLRQQITTVRSKVLGTDESRISIRSQIWGMTMQFNPPSLWTMLNLSDTGDPIAQVLAGEQIDLDAFVASAGPNSEKRIQNIASDPFSAAQFFHLSVRIILEEMFGISRGEYRDHPTKRRHSSVMKSALARPEFQDRLKRFIKANIRADLVGMSGEEQHRAAPVPNVAYCRPEDPRLPDYPRRRDESERRTAITAQKHQCRLNSCQVQHNGRYECKRRAPWKEAPDDWVLPNGECGPKRSYGYMNGWNPPLQQVTHCNQDMKFISNGADTKDITFYITLYIAKRQIQAANASALLATSFQFAKEREMRAQQSLAQRQRDEESREANNRLLVQCANTLNRQQELSAPEVISYIMGWGDRYISHTFVPLYWNELWHRKNLNLNAVSHHSTNEDNVAEDQTPERVEEEPLVRIANDSGSLVLKDQLRDYRERGEELEDFCLYRFLTETYDGPSKNAEEGDNTPGPGRPTNARVPYLPQAERSTSRILRSHNAEACIQVVGQWFPRSTDVHAEYYAAQMLALLSPATFAAFMEEAPQKIHDIVENIQYYYDASDRSTERRNVEAEEQRDQHEMGVDDGPEPTTTSSDEPVTQEDIDEARRLRYPRREEDYGEGALRVAEALGIFSSLTPEVPTTADAPIATQEEEATYVKWAEHKTYRLELLEDT